MAAKCHCSDQVHRIREGTYRVFDKVVIIRVSMQSHVADLSGFFQLSMKSGSVFI